jgi:hypothetical protein
LLSNGARVLKQETFLFLFCRCLLQLGAVRRESRSARCRMFNIWPIWSKLLCIWISWPVQFAWDLVFDDDVWFAAEAWDVLQKLGINVATLFLCLLNCESQTTLFSIFDLWLLDPFSFFCILFADYLELFVAVFFKCKNLLSASFLAILMLEP